MNFSIVEMHRVFEYDVRRILVGSHLRRFLYIMKCLVGIIIADECRITIEAWVQKICVFIIPENNREKEFTLDCEWRIHRDCTYRLSREIVPARKLNLVMNDVNNARQIRFCSLIFYVILSFVCLFKVAPRLDSNFSKSSTEFYTNFSNRENGMGIFKKI